MLQTALVFLLGTCLGSFLNVCVYRLPRQESPIWPRSHCMRCKRTLPLWWNVPVVSYLILRGRCRFCEGRIPPTYLLVEVLTGVLLVLVWKHYGLSLSFLRYSVLILLLLTISFIDLHHKLILNVLTFPGIGLGLLLSGLTSEPPIVESIAGLVLGGGTLWLIGRSGKVVFKQESMGAGDIKLGAMIGTFLGAKVMVALFLAFLIAAPVVLIGLLTGRLRVGSTIPFGPFLSSGAVLLVCFGPQLYEFYLSLIGLA